MAEPVIARKKRINKSAFFLSYAQWSVPFSHFGFFFSFSVRRIVCSSFTLWNKWRPRRPCRSMCVCDASLFRVFCIWASEPLKMSLNRWLALWFFDFACCRALDFVVGVIYEQNSSSNSLYILIICFANIQQPEIRKQKKKKQINGCVCVCGLIKMICETRPQKRK